jgi:hypothetical protein
MDYLKTALAYLKAHWVTVLALAMAVWAYAEPTVVDYVHNHPHLSFWYGLVAVVVAFFLKSPVSKIIDKG